jgi:DNA-binding transcriptional LysR family regulator
VKMLRTSLDQWLVLQAVIDAGGFARAAERLHRSQSAVSYAVAKLQEQLGVQLLVLAGRKARLTQTGKVLLEYSRRLVQDARELENIARDLEKGWETEVRLTVDKAFPGSWTIAALQEFSRAGRTTEVRLKETVMSGVAESLQNDDTDLAIGISVPADFMGDRLAEIDFVAIAHPDHPLHRLERTLSAADLRHERQVIISDPGINLQRDEGWLGAEQKWHVATLETALAVVSAGLCFGWLPTHMIEESVREGRLKPLPLREGGCRRHTMYLIYARQHQIGPAAAMLAQLLRDAAGASDSEHPVNQAPFG